MNGGFSVLEADGGISAATIHSNLTRGMFSLYSNGAENVRINGDNGSASWLNGGGNVGIGTSSPAYLLHVSGSIASFGGSVASGQRLIHRSARRSGAPRGGRDSIDHPPGGRDDVLNAAAGVLVHFTKPRPTTTTSAVEGALLMTEARLLWPNSPSRPVAAALYCASSRLEPPDSCLTGHLHARSGHHLAKRDTEVALATSNRTPRVPVESIWSK
jgi:hypothetical protein